MKKNNLFSELKIMYDSSILLALKQMDELKRKLLIVIKDGRFLSLLSIGDIQRAIIKGVSLDTQIKQILRADGKIRLASENDDFESIKKIMIHYKTEFMPVIDSNNNIINIYFWDEIFGETKLLDEDRL